MPSKAKRCISSFEMSCLLKSHRLVAYLCERTLLLESYHGDARWALKEKERRLTWLVPSLRISAYFGCFGNQTNQFPPPSEFVLQNVAVVRCICPLERNAYLVRGAALFCLRIERLYKEGNASAVVYYNAFQCWANRPLIIISFWC